MFSFLYTGEGISGVEDIELVCCLRKCKYNFNKAEAQILKYIETREEILNDLRRVDIKKLEHVLDHNVVGALPYRDRKGRVVIFTTPSEFIVNTSQILFY